MDFFGRRRLHEDLDEEIRSHIAMEVQQRIADGESPETARQNTLRELGSADLVKENTRDVWAGKGIESLLQDLRFGLRMLGRNPGFTAAAVIILSLGIGANAAIFSGINGLLLQKIPANKPDELVRFRWVGRNDATTSIAEYGHAEEDGVDANTTFSYAMYQQFRETNRTMLDLIAGAPVGVNVVADGQADIASGFIASGNYFNVLGVKAVRGRTLTIDDDRPSVPPAAVISDAYWKRRFGSDPNAIGKVVSANNTRVTIVGVIASDFNGIQYAVSHAPDITFTLSTDSAFDGARPGTPPRMTQGTYWWLQIVGRVKPGVTRQEVLANFGTVFENTMHAHLNTYLDSLTPEQRETSRNRNRTQFPHLRISSASRGVYDIYTEALRQAEIMGVVVILVLLIVCANVANLLLSRASARQKEISIRLSIGATRIRLIRQVLTESVLLALMGAALGAFAAYWGRQLLPGPAGEAPVDWRFFLFVCGLAFATGVLFGIAPAFRTTAQNPGSVLKENSRTIIRSRGLLRKSLLVAQIAISIILLVGAGLFLRTLRNLHRTDVGFNPNNMVLFQVDPRLNRYDQPKVNSVYRQILDKLTAVPGVRAVTFSDFALLSGSQISTDLFVEGRSYSSEPQSGINHLAIGEDFFEVVGIPLVAGRGFTASDTATSPKVAILNEAGARKFFPNENPIGKRCGHSPETATEMEIIGVVRDAKYNSVRDTSPPTMYVSIWQGRLGPASFEVRTAVDPTGSIASIREAVRQADPDLPIMKVSTQMDEIDGLFQQETLFARAYSLFGTLSLLIASIGLFALMSYSVTSRTNEIGIRMALGQERWGVVSMVMRESLILVAVGILIGLAASWGASRFTASLLYGLSPDDGLTISLASLTMFIVSALAAYLPARRESIQLWRYITSNSAPSSEEESGRGCGAWSSSRRRIWTGQVPEKRYSRRLYETRGIEKASRFRPVSQ
jgi:predicted permease